TTTDTEDRLTALRSSMLAQKLHVIKPHRSRQPHARSKDHSRTRSQTSASWSRLAVHGASTHSKTSSPKSSRFHSQDASSKTLKGSRDEPYQAPQRVALSHADLTAICSGRITQHLQPAAHRLHPLWDHSEQDRRLSREAAIDCSAMRDSPSREQSVSRDWLTWLQQVARVLTQDGRQMTGSYAEGWANSLVQSVNGQDSCRLDIDWTVLVAGQEFHLEGGAVNRRVGVIPAKTPLRCRVKEGHAQVAVGA
uniref:Pecanex_C domain-containing protein n=1 Tax=Macrostomum lignano TaxID=282301 RepID=A0A1I8FFS4_9PLAT